MSAEDFLDVDPPIHGQKFACLSFISPEDVLQGKEEFMLMKFSSQAGEDVKHMLDQLEDKFKGDAEASDMVFGLKEKYAFLWSEEDFRKEYGAFKAVRGLQLEEQYHQQNDFRTTMRGIKVRGVYGSEKEARHRAEAIRKFDSNFNVYVAQVGYWCPWSPDPDEVQDVEYAESHLNALMKKYKENCDKSRETYEKRKTAFMERAQTRKKQTVIVDEPEVASTSS